MVTWLVWRLHLLPYPLHTTPEKFENTAIIGHFGIVFEKNSIIIVALSFSDFKMFFVHAKA